MPITGSQAAKAYARLYAGPDPPADAALGLFRASRVGATRLGYFNPRTFVQVAGTARYTHFDDLTWTISRQAGTAGATATIDLFGFTPSEGQSLVIALGSPNNGLLFRGTLVTVVQKRQRLTEGRLVYRCTAVDARFLFNRRKVNGHWTGLSATAVAQAVLAGWTSGFTGNHLQVGLPTLDDFPVTLADNSGPGDVFDRLAAAVGGYWYIDDTLDVHLWTGGAEPNVVAPDAVTSSSLRKIRAFQYARSLAQVRTRVIVEGEGASIPAGVPIGNTTIPVVDSTVFGASTGSYEAKVGTQRVTYTGKSTSDGLGSTVTGKALSPSAPSGAATSTAGALIAGTRKYRTSFVTPAGESEAGTASGNVTISDVTPPSTAGMGVTPTTGGSIPSSRSYLIYVTYVTAAGESVPTLWGQATTGASDTKFSYSGIPTSGDARVTGRKIYRTPSTGAQAQLAVTINDNVTTTGTDALADASLGAMIVFVATAGTGQVSLTGIPLGPTGTTARRMYRTVAGGSTYFLQSTIADNVTTTGTDNVADNALGDVALASSQVGASPGDITLGVADLSLYPAVGWVTSPSGGWISYSGRSAGSGAGTLNNVPPGGDGSIGAVIPYGSAVLCAPFLTGVPASSTGSITEAINAGDQITLLVTRNDTSAQTALAAIEGGDGIHEYFVQDRRLSMTSAQARADAELLMNSTVVESGAHTCEDREARVGRLLTITMTEWSITGLTVPILSERIFKDPDKLWPQREITWGDPQQQRSLYDLVRTLQAQSAPGA